MMSSRPDRRWWPLYQRNTHWSLLCQRVRDAVNAADPDWKLGPNDRGQLHVVVRALGNERLAREDDASA